MTKMTMGVAEQFLHGRQLNGRAGLDDLDAVWTFLNDDEALAGFRYEGGRLLFRGQTTGRYGLTSSLYRSVQEELDAVERDATTALPSREHKYLAERTLAEAERAVLKAAKDNGIGRGLSAVETLALLQHHLSPTRLLDVSSSALVSLFFAVERNDDVAGRVFFITVPPIADEDRDLVETDSPDDLPWSVWIDGRLNSPGTWSRKVWHLDIPPLDARMRAQQGTFLVGGLASNSGDNPQNWRSTDEGRTGPLSVTDYRKVSTLTINVPATAMKPTDNESWSAYGWSLEIPADWKRELRKRPKEEHGIEADSIYPPVDEVRRLLEHVAKERTKETLAEFGN